MGKSIQVVLLLVAFFGVFSFSDQAGVLDVLDQPALLQNRLNDAAFVRKTVACVLDQGPCDVFGNLVKGATPDIITYRCSRCTPQQRINAEGLQRTLAQRYPREWAAVLAKYQNNARG